MEGKTGAGMSKDLDIGFECTAYKRMAKRWRRLRDIYEGLDSWIDRSENGIQPTTKAQQYLPKEAAEEWDDWVTRLVMSPFDDRFAQSLRKFINLIFSNKVELTDLPTAIAAHLENIDNQGTSFRAFCRRKALDALIDGHTFVLVEYPDATGLRSHADFLAANLRPYWVSYSADQLINWVTYQHQGQTVLVQATLREVLTIAEPFGERQVERYRVLRPGNWEVWEKWDDSGQVKYQRMAKGNSYDATGEIMTTIPLYAIYGGVKVGFFESKPPLQSLADRNVSHYQITSDHLRKIHLCCLPVPELRDSMREDGEPLRIGPNSFIHIRDPQGSFNWKEPLATSIEQSRREKLDAEEAMDVISAAYLSQPSDRQAATTTLVQVLELESSLGGFAESLSDGVNQCLRSHAEFLGTTLQPSAKFSGDVVKDSGKDAQLLTALSNLAEKGQITGKTLLVLLKNGAFLPENFNIDAEMVALGLNRDGQFLRVLLELPSMDVTTKREFMGLLQRYNFLPKDFDIEASIKATGEEIRIAAVGALRSQPTPNNEFLAPPGSPPPTV